MTVFVALAMLVSVFLMSLPSTSVSAAPVCSPSDQTGCTPGLCSSSPGGNWVEAFGGHPAYCAFDTNPGITPGSPEPVADSAATSGNCTNLGHCDLIDKYINPLINFLAALVGVIVVVSIIIGGIQYSSSAGDPQATSAAKKRIVNAIIALVTFIFLYAILNFIVPGGLFNK